MARILFYFASLLLAFAGIEAQLCGKDLDNYKYRVLNDCFYPKLAGKWYVWSFYDSEKILLKDTKCVNYDYEALPNREYSITKNEQFKNGTNVNVKQKIKFEEGTTNNLNYLLDVDDPNAYDIKGIAAEYDLSNGDPNNHYLAYYACTTKENGKKWTLFMLLTRQYPGQGNSYLFLNEQRIKKDLGLLFKIPKKFGSSQCKK